MTGFGAARVDELTVEIRTVNHRHLDVRWHAPPELSGAVIRLEPEIKRQLRRGRVDIRVVVERPEGERALFIDASRARAAVDGLRRLGDELGLQDDLRLADLIGVPGVVRSGSELPIRAEALPGAVRDACRQVVEMRRIEGAATARELGQRLDRIRTTAANLKARLGSATPRRAEQLRRRLQELLQGASVDEARLAQEVAMLADRSDVSEELERLDSHTQQFVDALGDDDPVGRKLDFLTQELVREVNTIGSKASEATLLVVELKSELEKVREQVQNLE
jgi:uncharacterized protein (TIGR00255 family)